MNRRLLFLLALAATITAGSTRAQFLGDALASAGLNITEYQASEMIAASGAINDPTLTTASSAPPTTHAVQTPATVGTDVGVTPRPTGSAGSSGSTSPASSSGSPTSYTPAGTPPPMGGSATAFSGVAAHAASIDPKAAAAWRDAFRPAGTKVPKPPADALKLETFGASYSYSKGMFFKESGGAWQVVAAPVGAVIPEKPVGAATVFAGGKPSSYYAGTFYVYDAATKGYAVVQPPIGATVDYLPESASKVQWQGSTHYEYAGTHYRPYYRGSSVVYTVAGS